MSVKSTAVSLFTTDVSAVTREKDFNQLLRYGSTADLENLKNVLKKCIGRILGRSTEKDLLESRLTQVRRTLSAI